MQTYTYSVKTLSATSVSRERSQTSEQGLSSSTSGEEVGAFLSGSAVTASQALELQLVLEYCDFGSLRDALDQGSLHPLGRPNYTAVLETAADVAKGMLHLHACGIVHSDLKASHHSIFCQLCMLFV